jgi:hypothetical protein
MPQHLDIWFRLRRLFPRTDGLYISTAFSPTYTDNGAGKMSSCSHKDGPLAAVFGQLLKGSQLIQEGCRGDTGGK